MKSDVTLLDEGLITTGVQACNLCEINGAKCKTKEEFFDACRAAAIIGTCQAGYTNFSNLVDVLEDTISISKFEALLGISITGLTNSPYLFNADILKQGAEIIVKTNEEVAKIIGINPSARLTTV